MSTSPSTMPFRISRAWPASSGSSIRKGLSKAGAVCTGTMIVRPATVIALWSEGPAPPRRLLQPALGSASLTPCDCKALINCSIGIAVAASGFIIGSPGAGEGKGGKLRHSGALQGRRGSIVEIEVEEFGAGIVTDRIHHPLALDDEAHVEIGNKNAFALG